MRSETKTELTPKLDAAWIDEVLPIAEAATDGPWKYNPNADVAGELYGVDAPEPAPAAGEVAFTYLAKNAKHIATFDPPTVIRLLKELRRLRRETSRQWSLINQERGALIDKNIAGTITDSERVRLDILQAYADEYLEHFRAALAAQEKQ